MNHGRWQYTVLRLIRSELGVLQSSVINFCRKPVSTIFSTIIVEKFVGKFKCVKFLWGSGFRQILFQIIDLYCNRSSNKGIYV